MLRTTKNMKDKYEKIQNYIFSLIPEKWEEIYLYASAIKEQNKEKLGEMFFYYLPKGILKKKYINVYEVPQRFNVNEEQYLKIVEELYKCIKSLQQDFEDTDQEIWTNLTISIKNLKFFIEYKYDKLPITEEEINTRNIIWKYKYLKIGGENKYERKILEDYYLNPPALKREIYETGLYIKTDINKITFDKESGINDQEFVMYEKEDIVNILSKTKNKIYKGAGKRKKEDKKNEDEEKDEQEETHTKNQILNE